MLGFNVGLPRGLREEVRGVGVSEQQALLGILKILKGQHPKTPSSGYIPVAHSPGTGWKLIGQVGKEKREAHPPSLPSICHSSSMFNASINLSNSNGKTELNISSTYSPLSLSSTV